VTLVPNSLAKRSRNFVPADGMDLAEPAPSAAVLGDMSANQAKVLPSSPPKRRESNNGFLRVSEPPRRLAVLPPAYLESLEVLTGPKAAGLPLALPEYGFIGVTSSSVPPALVFMSGIRAVNNDSPDTATQPAPALLRRAIATTSPPPSDGSLICIRRL